jgi:hypothetical protein
MTFETKQNETKTGKCASRQVVGVRRQTRLGATVQVFGRSHSGQRLSELERHECDEENVSISVGSLDRCADARNDSGHRYCLFTACAIFLM